MCDCDRVTDETPAKSRYQSLSILQLSSCFPLDLCVTQWLIIVSLEDDAVFDSALEFKTEQGDLNHVGPL